jgi:hypothetical protein
MLMEIIGDGAIAFWDGDAIALFSYHILLKLVVFSHHFFSQYQMALIVENLLIVNRFIPKSATRLTVGLANTAIAALFMYFFFSNQSDRLVE